MIADKVGQVSEEEYTEAVNNEMGWCTNCQAFTREMCEPDACEYDCPECEQNTVFGAEEALMQGLIEIE